MLECGASFGRASAFFNLVRNATRDSFLSSSPPESTDFFKTFVGRLGSVSTEKL